MKQKFQTVSLTEVIEKINTAIESYNNQFATALKQIHSGSICFNENAFLKSSFLTITWEWKKIKSEKVLEVSIEY